MIEKVILRHTSITAAALFFGIASVVMMIGLAFGSVTPVSPPALTQIKMDLK